MIVFPVTELKEMLASAEMATEVELPVGRYRALVMQAALAPMLTGAHNLGAMLGRQWPGSIVKVEAETYRDLVLQAITALPRV